MQELLVMAQAFSHAIGNRKGKELLTRAFKTYIYIAFIFATLSAQVASNTTLPEYLQGNTYL